MACIVGYFIYAKVNGEVKEVFGPVFCIIIRLIVCFPRIRSFLERNQGSAL
jgi:hypothetical protein